MASYEDATLEEIHAHHARNRTAEVLTQALAQQLDDDTAHAWVTVNQQHSDSDRTVMTFTMDFDGPVGGERSALIAVLSRAKDILA